MSPEPDPGAEDKLYVGSVWRGTSTAKGVGGTTVEQRWELVVTTRKGDAFRADAYLLDNLQNTKPRPLSGTVRANGAVNLLGTGNFVPRLGIGKLTDELILFGPPPGVQQRFRRNDQSTMELKYIPPKR